MQESDLILEADDVYAWVEERREYAALEQSDSVPSALRGVYKGSLAVGNPQASRAPQVSETAVRYLHAFDASGYAALSRVDWSTFDDDSEARPRLVTELLEAVRYLHLRGLPHLSLNADFVRVGRDATGRARLKLIGVGAGPKLVATRRPFSIPELWSFNAPETMGGALIESNLRALLLMDAWSVGVLVAMIVTRDPQSPFEAEADWRRGVLSSRQAVSERTKTAFSDFAFWLSDADAKSQNLLFDRGWIARLLLGLLTRDPNRRMSVRAASDFVAQRFSPAAPGAAAMGTQITYAPRLPVSRGGTNTTWEAPPVAAKDIAAAADNATADAPPESRPRAPAPPRGNATGAPRAPPKPPGKAPMGRFGPDDVESAEPFRSLEAMLAIAGSGECKCVLERARTLRLGGLPYGEVVGFRNRADGDRWDIFVPGLPASNNGAGALLPQRIKRVHGVVLIKGGNHKLAVELEHHPPAGNEAVLADVRKYMDLYAAQHPTSKDRIRYLEYDSA